MRHSYEDRMRRVLDYIHDNPAGDLSLDRLADVAAMSRFHWHRVFHAMTGETCAQATRRVRLNRAASWLVDCDRPIARIAADVGYGSVQSFTRAFSEAYGDSPARFRANGRLIPPRWIRNEKGQNMYPVDIETHPDRRVLAVPHTGAFLGIGKAFDRLGSILAGRGRYGDVRAMVGVFHDDPSAVDEAALRSHAGVVVDADAPGEEGLEEITLPGGRFAALHYKGPYQGLSAAYGFFYGEWLAGARVEPRNAPCFELYLNSPMDTAPEDLLTDICLPVE